jgi:hypothetical protein
MIKLRITTAPHYYDIENSTIIAEASNIEDNLDTYLVVWQKRFKSTTYKHTVYKRDYTGSFYNDILDKEINAEIIENRFAEDGYLIVSTLLPLA